jgi:hypothetical protein
VKRMPWMIQGQCIGPVGKHGAPSSKHVTAKMPPEAYGDRFLGAV